MDVFPTRILEKPVEIALWDFTIILWKYESLKLYFLSNIKEIVSYSKVFPFVF